MAQLIEKRGKFIRSVGYSTAFGHEYSWTHNELEARRFEDDNPNVAFHVKQVHGRIKLLPNTKQERRQLGRRAMRYHQ